MNYCKISQPSTFLEYLKMLNISTFLRISQPSPPFISNEYLKFSNISNQYLKLNNISNLAISQMLNISNLAISQMLNISISEMLQYLKSSNISNLTISQMLTKNNDRINTSAPRSHLASPMFGVPSRVLAGSGEMMGGPSPGAGF